MKINGSPTGGYLLLKQGQSEDEDDDLSHVKSLEAVVDISATDSCKKDISPESDMDVETKPVMGPARKFWFIASLILCLFFIVTVTWLLPCTLPKLVIHPVSNEQVIMKNFRITSNMVAKEMKDEDPTLIFGYEATDNQSRKLFGLTAVNGYNGKTFWNQQLYSAAEYIECKMIDLNNDSIADCFLKGKNGLLTAFNSVDGQFLWFLHNHDDIPSPIKISNPLIIPDCDADKVDDMIFFYHLQNDSDEEPNFFYKSTSFLAVVSSSMGKVVSNIEIPCFKSEQMVVRWKQNSTADVILACLDVNHTATIWWSDTLNFCKKSVSDNYQSQSFKMVDSFSSSRPTENFAIEILKFGYKEELVASLNQQLIVAFDDQYRLKWKVQFEKPVAVRLLLPGRFLSKSALHLAIISSTNNWQSEVSFYDPTTGTPVELIAYKNGTIVSAFTMRQDHSSKDSIIVKAIHPSSRIQFNLHQELDHLQSPDTMTKFNSDVASVKFFEESYYILEKPLSIFRKISSHIISAVCYGLTCSPDIQSSKPSAIIARGSQNSKLLYIDVTSSLGTGYPVHYETVVKKVQLNDQITLYNTHVKWATD